MGAMTDQIEIADPGGVADREFECPETDCTATLVVDTDAAFPPDYGVECPRCGFEDIWIAG